MPVDEADLARRASPGSRPTNMEGYGWMFSQHIRQAGEG
jgi:hypothetical protein